jgi:Dolichyl-phosphate-mannose-protein mannosyltransferase
MDPNPITGQAAVFTYLKKRSRILFGLCVLCVFLLLPFAARPLHIDDPMFVWAAQHIVHHPSNFYGYLVNWEGIIRPMAKIFPIPPLTSYFLAAVSCVVGWNAFSLHLTFLPISLATVVGIYFLAARFCSRPGLCVLLVLLCPAFWVSSTTLMCETPLLCLWVWGTLLWIWGSQRSAWFFLPATLLVALCILTKFTALGLIPLLALHAVLKSAPAPIRIMQVVSLASASAVCIFYNSVFFHLYGIGALENAALYASNSRAMLDIPFGLGIFDTLAFVGGGGFIACLLVLLVIWRPWARIVVVAFALIATVLLASSAFPPPGWISQSASNPGITTGSIAFYFQFVLLFALAVVLMINIGGTFTRGWRRGHWRDDAFLISWIASIFIFAGFLNWSINCRSILPMIPAVCIMVVRGLDRFERLPSIPTAVAILIGGALALAVTIGDYHLAVTGKMAADILPGEIARSTFDTTNHKVWLAGHWGLQYYLQPKGFEQLDGLSPAIKPGDFILFANDRFGGNAHGQGFVLVRNMIIGKGCWVSTADPYMGAGFYHSNGYLLPFVFGPIPPASFTLVQTTANSQVHP